MQRYAVFLDIDGTYGLAGNRLLEENVQTIRAVQAAGHKVFLNTGRALGNIPKHLYEAVPLDGVVAAGGACLLLGDRLLRYARMSQDIIDEIEAVFLQNGRLCVFEGEQTNYLCNPRNPVPDGWHRVWQKGDMRRLFADARITKCTLGGFLEEEHRLSFAREMYAIYHPDYTEMILNGFSKATGMDEMCRACGIDPKNTIAMGDSPNDIPMLQHAGIAVVMGDGQDSVKPLAHYLTHAPHDRGGVAEALRHFLL